MLFPITVAALSIWLALAYFNSSDRKLAEDLLGYVTSSFAVRQDIHIRVGDLGLRFPDLVDAAQAQLNHRLKGAKIPYVYNLVDEIPKYVVRPRNIDFEPEEVILTPVVIETEVKDTETRAETKTETEIETTAIAKSPKSFNANSTLRKVPEYYIELVLADKVAIWLDIHELKVTLTYSLDSCHQNDVPFFLTQVIHDHLLKPDLSMFDNTLDFNLYIPKLKVNFIAAEELGETPESLKSNIRASMELLAAQISPYVETCVEFHVIDVTKKRAPSALLSNTTSTLNFFYLTSLAGITNKIQGVDLYHIHPEELEAFAEDPYGTAHSEHLKREALRGYESKAFVKDAALAVKAAVGLPDMGIDNVNLLVESMMKHFTISGLTALLRDLLEAETFDSDKLNKVAKLIDTIIAENNNDWSKHLKCVYELHKSSV